MKEEEALSSGKEKIILCWSGGKDSAMALYEILNSPAYTVVALLTTLTDTYDRISMHGVRRSLLEKQVDAIGIPLHKIFISKQSSNTEYESKMEAACLYFKNQGVNTVAFGDIFLEDLREYREKNLAKLGMKGLFPIWKRDTTELIRSFIQRGFKAVLTCIDPKSLDSSFVGRSIDEGLIHDLPSRVDPCGENGEFHSFVYDGPIFHEEVKFSLGDKVLRDSFWFCDLVEVETTFTRIS